MQATQSSTRKGWMLFALVVAMLVGLLGYEGVLFKTERVSASVTDPVNLAASSRGTIATASSSASNRPPGHTNDGDTGTSWGPLTTDVATGEVWLALNFGAATAFDRVKLDFVVPGASAALPLSYTIKVLNDPSFTGTYDDNPAKWTTVASRVLADYASGSLDDVSFTKSTAKKMTIVFVTDPGGFIPRVEEVEVYEMSRTLASVTVHAAKLVLNDDKQTAVEVTGTMSDGGLAPLIGATFTWSSGNAGVVAVAASGSALSTATGVSPGQTAITASVTLGGVTKQNQLVLTVRNPALEDDYDRLRQKVKDSLVGADGYNPSDSDISAAIAKINTLAEPLWSSMNTNVSANLYLWSDLTTGSIFDAEDSYGRLLALARAYELPESTMSPATKTAVRKAIIDGMAFLNTNWYNASIAQNEQWYKFEIGVPSALLKLNVLMYDDLIAQGKQALITAQMNAIHHFSPDPADSRSATSAPRIGYMTGANLVEKSYNEALIGILLKDTDALELSGDRIVDVFDYVTSGDGFYEDGSFIQHNDIAYTGSYGLVLVGVLPAYMDLLNDSNWELTDPRASRIFDWVYESYEPLFFRGVLMDMVRGRAMSRAGSQDLQAGRTLLTSLPTIASFASPTDAANLKGIVKKWANSGLFSNFYTDLSIQTIQTIKSIMSDPAVVAREMPVRHKQFPAMDRIVHHRPGFTFAISMSSQRIGVYEYQQPPNQENIRGYYTGFGMTYLYNDDVRQFNEDYWPTVDAHRLPGITVDYQQTRSVGSGNKYKSPVSWVGGTDISGLYGVAGMQIYGYQNTLVGKKSWFMFDDEIVALGAGIASTSGRPIETVVENRKLNGAGNNVLKVNGTIKSGSLGWTETMSNTSWVHLQGDTAGADIGYYFPGGATIKGIREARTGAWVDINPYHNPSGINVAQPHTRNYLSLRFDHGSNPTNGQYAYVMLPGQTATQVSQYASNADITVVENSSSVQAVRESELGIFAANFWNDGTRTVGPITSNKKASVMTRVVGSTLEVSVSDPTQLNTDNIEVEIEESVAELVSKDSRITIVRMQPSLKLRVNVNGAKGRAIHAAFTLGPPSDGNVLPPVADSYIKGGTDAGVNYGSSDLLKVKGTTNSNLVRKGLLKFDLSGMATAAEAVLRLKGSSGGSPGTLKVYEASPDSWTESTVTWNNAPAIVGSMLDSITVGTTEQVYELDVTEAIRQALGSGRGSITFLLEGVASEDLLMEFRSLESSSGQPALYVRGIEQNAQLTRVAPAADATVRGGTSGNDNYGTSGLLKLYESTNANVKRKAYLKFDLSQFASISGAALQLYGLSDVASQVSVYRVASDSWTESGLTWNNAPSSSGAAVASFQTTTSGKFYQLDLTALAQSELSGDGILSLVLQTGTSIAMTDINSKENGTYPPQLIVSGALK
ncbi:CBM96 family carbohydrate-binding protein [Paenibacillus koleovorans]|uniref:CBM96 family carbohydrate-binding protein n=1 Tax=Paenibacillus koleovorans TaxID=121608 RepID=UPI000FDCA86B|nr:polysaccharide lyase family 8 super-sandwich domain-containing protein [Paenibacillus koleovorans]